MGNLFGMEDELAFPEHEAMVEWLRRNRQESTSQPEALQLPLPEGPVAKPVSIVRRVPVIIDIC